MFHFDEKFWLAIAFFVLLGVMIRYVWPFLAKALDEKSKKIAEEILAAKEMKQKAERLLIEAENFYRESTSLAQKLLKDAEIEAQKFAEESRQMLQKEVDKKTVAALERIRLEQESALREVKTKIIDSAIKEFSAKIGSDQTVHQKILDKTTRELTGRFD